jgi:ribosome-associated toxin RatA of RatAB toxin-antitoxin module
MSKLLECSALVPYSPQQMFELVNDVEAYPSFMNGCTSARIIEKGDQWLTACLELEKSGFKQSFTTRNQLLAPDKIIMELVSGPFKIFNGVWQFQSIQPQQCQVSFRLEYEFSNMLMNIAAGKIMQGVVDEQVNAICQRARSLYKA